MLSCQLLFRLDSENQDEKLLIRNSRQILRIAFQLNTFVNEINFVSIKRWLNYFTEKLSILRNVHQFNFNFHTIFLHPPSRLNNQQTLARQSFAYATGGTSGALLFA